MKPTIRALWRGEVPREGESAELKCQLDDIVKEKERLMRIVALQVDDEGYRALLDYAELNKKYTELCLANAYEDGFSLGTKLTAEAFTHEKNNRYK